MTKSIKMISLSLVGCIIFSGCSKTPPKVHLKRLPLVPNMVIRVQKDGTLDAKNTSKIFKQVHQLRNHELYYDDMIEHYNKL